MSDPRWRNKRSWGHSEKERVAELWPTGLATSKMAKILNDEFDNGRSRNAVIGIVGRMGLVRRESPIRPKGTGKRPGQRDRQVTAWAPLPGFTNNWRSHVNLAMDAPAPRVCQWQIWETSAEMRALIAAGAPTCCGGPLEIGRSYCAEHYRQTTVRQPHRSHEEELAA